MDSNDGTLIKVAVFGIAMSLFCSMGITLFLSPGGDYDFDEIQGYRDDLIDFSGESMINQSPWILTSVYTPWIPSTGTDGHVDPDGWLYGEAIQYSEIGKSADISLDPSQKSTVPLMINPEPVRYEQVTGVEWWADLGPFTPIGVFIGNTLLKQDPLIRSDMTAGIWNYTGYRYVFDPTLPFKNEASTVDGSLSIVWYNYNGQEGLSGGLQIYGGETLLSNISATEIISAYQSTAGLASTYDFVFDGAHLTLSVRFDQNVIDAGVPLMQAWTQGDWTMAVSSVSAGNFLDVEGSNAYSFTAGSVIDTYIDIFTFSTPSINNWWMDLILWLMVGLPFSVALICISLRTVQAFKLF